jgi:predicted aspartyl protease
MLSAQSLQAAKSAPIIDLDGYQLTQLGKTLYKRSRFSSIQWTNRLLVNANINGHSTALILDTGASKTVINPRFLKQLGLDYIRKGKLIAEGKGNGVLVPIIKIHSLSIGNVSSHDLLAATAQAPSMVLFRGSRIIFSEDGVLGADFLQKHGAIIDCERGELFLKTNEQAKDFVNQTLPANGWIPVAFRITPLNQLVISATINGKAIDFLLDTGAPTSILNRSLAKELKISGSWRRYKAVGINTADPYAQIGKVDSIVLGGYTGNHLELGLTDAWEHVQTKDEPAGSHFSGILGIDFLGNNLAFIDYQNRTLYLKHPAK